MWTPAFLQVLCEGGVDVDRIQTQLFYYSRFALVHRLGLQYDGNTRSLQVSVHLQQRLVLYCRGSHKCKSRQQFCYCSCRPIEFVQSPSQRIFVVNFMQWNLLRSGWVTDSWLIDWLIIYSLKHVIKQHKQWQQNMSKDLYNVCQSWWRWAPNFVYSTWSLMLWRLHAAIIQLQYKIYFI